MAPAEMASTKRCDGTRYCPSYNLIPPIQAINVSGKDENTGGHALHYFRIYMSSARAADLFLMYRVNGMSFNILVVSNIVSCIL